MATEEVRAMAAAMTMAAANAMATAEKTAVAEEMVMATILVCPSRRRCCSHSLSQNIPPSLRKWRDILKYITINLKALSLIVAEAACSASVENDLTIT